MAKRAAAGTLALAVCLTGGAVAFAGAANASIPHATGNTGYIRILPSANPTLSTTTGTGTTATTTPGVANQSAPVIQSGVNGQAIADFQVVVPNGWVSGDQVRLSLPSGVTFSADSPSEPTISSAVTPVSLETKATASSDSAYTSLTAPKTSTAYQSGGVNKSTITTTFSNSADSGSTGAAFVLTFKGLKVDIASTFTGAITVTPTAYENGTGGVYSATPNTFDQAKTTVGFASSVQISQPTGQTLTPPSTTGTSSPAQSIGDITLSESVSTGLVNGTYSLQFQQGGVALAIDDTDPAGDAFDTTITASGAANRGAGTVARSAAASGTANTQLDLTLSGLRADSTVEALKISGLRVKTVSSAPVKTVVVAAPGTSSVGALPFVAVNGTAKPGTADAFSRTQNEALDADATISLTQAQNRIGGADRYETAARVAQQGLTARVDAQGKPMAMVDTVIVASGEQASGGVDALSANYLSGQLGAPILLTQKDNVPDATLVALRNLLNGTTAHPENARILVVGGSSAVSDAAVAQLRDAFATTLGNLTVQRVAGADRYATAASSATLLDRNAYKVGTYVQKFGQGASATAILTSGVNPADALAAGPVAYASHFPVLLTGVTSVPQATLDAIDSLGIRNIVLAGGTAAVSADVEAQLKTHGLSIYRVAGADRYETATKLYDWTTLDTAPTTAKPTGGLGYNSPTSPYLANGMSFADALVAGPLAGRQTVTTGTGASATTAAAPQPLLLTDPAKLSGATSAYLTDNKQSVNGKVIGVGLAAALPQATLQAAADASRN